MWRTSFPAVLWFIWKERNSRCFEGKVLPVEAMSDGLKFSIASWVSILPHFRGISIYLIMQGWRGVAFPAVID